ncbi:MAG: NUDIX domain-containing protein [Candidatus Colwellbacteria bacterium]|nr:NUDIX domain-containing protein [Candidatus Colwellbacteria bacterium]
MEYIDILDELGNPTGESKLRDNVHKDGDWHKSTHIWIINSDGKILVQKRSKIKVNYPDLWDISAAGHIFTGETSIEGGIREAKEELGIKLSKNEFEHLFVTTTDVVLNNGTYIEREFHDIFLVRKDLDLSKLKLQKEEVQKVKFVSLDELLKDCDKKSVFVPHKDEYNKLFSALRARKLIS